MKCSVLLAALAAVGCLFVGRSSADDAKAIQGTWIPEKAELAGNAWPDAVVKTIVLKLGDGTYEVSVAGKMDKGTFMQDATTKPKGLTIRGTEGPNSGKVFPCIYELEGDTLRVCYDLSGVKAPTEFTTAKGTQLYLVTYARKKE